MKRRGAQITIAVPDEASRFFLETEYGNLTRTALAELEIHDVQWTVEERTAAHVDSVQQVVAQTGPRVQRWGT